VTRIVKGLEKTGYLDRKPHETDGRTLRLYLTTTGESVCHQVSSAHKAYNDMRLDCITYTEQTGLIENLTTLNYALQQALQQENMLEPLIEQP
jgi:DNA-binding MarR family transcriptional regulator